jgi:hypothetical protein
MSPPARARKNQGCGVILGIILLIGIINWAFHGGGSQSQTAAPDAQPVGTATSAPVEPTQAITPGDLGRTNTQPTETKHHGLPPPLDLPSAPALAIPPLAARSPAVQQPPPAGRTLAAPSAAPSELPEAPIPPPPTDGSQDGSTSNPTGGPSPYYANCTAARAAGVAPLHRGEPGYRPKLDGDGDGVACE